MVKVWESMGKYDEKVHLYILANTAEIPMNTKTRAIVHAGHLQLINYNNTTGQVLAAANFFPEWGLFAAYFAGKSSQRDGKPMSPTKRRTVCAVLDSRLGLLACRHCTQYLILRKPQAKGYKPAVGLPI